MPAPTNPYYTPAHWNAFARTAGIGGQTTFNGTGAQTAFTIPHGLSAAPTSVLVTPGSTAANGAHSASADATNITVTYAAAPASGTNNVVLNWRAWL